MNIIFNKLTYYINNTGMVINKVVSKYEVLRLRDLSMNLYALEMIID